MRGAKVQKIDDTGKWLNDDLIRYKKGFMKVKDSVVIVTGASAGIGAAMVRRLAHKGARVVLVARRQERLDALAHELVNLPGERLVLAGDVTDQAFIKQMVAETMARFGRIDVLINNAGMGHRSDLAEIGAADLDLITRLNLYAPIYTTQAVLPVMQAQKQGQIINVSSIVSVRPLPHLAYYTATKAALDHITRGLRMELRHTPIVVTTVYPGRTKTEFHQAKLGASDNRRRIGVSAEKVAKAAVHAIEKEQKEVYITLFDRFFTLGNRHFPWFLDKLFGRVLVR